MVLLFSTSSRTSHSLGSRTGIISGRSEFVSESFLSKGVEENGGLKGSNP